VDTVPYIVIENHIYVFRSSNLDTKTVEIIQMNNPVLAEVKGKTAWRLSNNKENFELVNSLFPTSVAPPPDPLEDLRHVSIGLKNVLIRDNSFQCSNHKKIALAGEVPVLVRNGTIETYLIPIWYCETCRCFFVLDQTFKDLKKRGVIVCQVTDYETYKKVQNFHPWYDIPKSKWKEISPLRLCGYYVSVQNGKELTDKQRQGILEEIVDNEILPKDRVLSYLAFFKKNLGGQSAKDKWQSDYDYISQYKLNSAKRVIIKGFFKLYGGR